MFRSKKAMTEGLNLLPKIGITLLVVGLIFAIMFQMFAEQRTEVKDELMDSEGLNMTDTEAEAHASLGAIDDTTEAAQAAAGKVGFIVTVILAVLVLSVVLIYLWPLVQNRLR